MVVGDGGLDLFPRGRNNNNVNCNGNDTANVRNLHIEVATYPLNY